MELNGNRFNGLREFANFRLDAEKRVLWSGDALVDLPPRAIDVLCVLTEQPGEVVSKTDLLTAVWKESFVEESNLTHQIYELRKAFKEHGCGDELIQTVPRRGYRFTGKLTEVFLDKPETVVERRTISRALIEELIDHEPVVQIPPPQAVAPLAIHMPQKRRSWVPRVVGILILGILVLGFLGYWLGSGGQSKTSLADIRTIAVLPIRSIDGSTDESLETRLTDSIITKLGTLRTASIRPTSSVLRLRDATADPVEAGRLLEVDAVLAGRTQTENGRIRLNIQMISVASGEQIWSAQIDGEADRILSFQDAVANKLLSSLDVSSDQAKALGEQFTANVEAFEEYTKGRYFWNKRSPESLRLAIAAYTNAVRLDPDFAEAYAGLADSYFLLVDYSYDTSDANVRAANENLDKALSIDPQLAEAYVTRGLIQSRYEWKWSEAEASLRKAIDLSPGSSSAHHRYGLVLAKLGRFAEADEEMATARRLDPTSPSINMNVGVVYLFSERYELAAEQLQKAIELDPTFASPRWYIARCRWMQGRRDEALSLWAEASKVAGMEDSAKLLQNLERSAPEVVVQRLIEHWKPLVGSSVSSHDIAKLYAAIGDKDGAMEWLERSLAERHPWLTSVAVEPEFIVLRNDPRFISLKQKLNLK